VVDIMRISNTMLATAFLGLLTCGILNSAQAAPLPTNMATMKSMSTLLFWLVTPGPID
jgi:hypothetical protein